MSRWNSIDSDRLIQDVDPAMRRAWMGEDDPAVHEEMSSMRLIQAAGSSERLAKMRQKRSRIQYIYAKYSSLGNSLYDSHRPSSDGQKRSQESTPLLIHQSPKNVLDDRDASSCDERDHRVDEILTVPELLQRCTITVSGNSETKVNRSIKPSNSSMKLPQIKKSRSASIRSRAALQQSQPAPLKKSVHFYKYDEVIDSSNKTEYVYSLYEKETEQEKAEHDVVDDIEGVVNDVGYFFQCLSEGLKEEASKTLFHKNRSSSGRSKR
jgi:hypothetical protein